MISSTAIQNQMSKKTVALKTLIFIMERRFIEYLVDPNTKEPLTFVEFESKEENIISGIFINEKSNDFFAIHSGVPVMFANSISASFHENFKDKLAAYPK